MNIEIIENVCLLVLCTVAAVTDVHTWKVPNLWVFPWMAAGVVLSALSVLEGGIIESVMGMAAPVLILGLFFYFRMIGAGDIKMFCAIGAWTGVDGVLMSMLWTFAAALVISVVRFAVNRNFKARLAYLRDYLKGYLGSGVKVNYASRKDKSARLHMCVPILISVIIRWTGVFA